jgi:hypothetical protein
MEGINDFIKISFLILCFTFLSPFQNLLFEFQSVGEFHPQIKFSNKNANMKEYINSCIFFFIVYILFLLSFFSPSIFKF